MLNVSATDNVSSSEASTPQSAGGGACGPLYPSKEGSRELTRDPWSGGACGGNSTER